jgi:hypothetical protein
MAVILVLLINATRRISDSIYASDDRMKLEEERSKFRRLQNSWRYKTYLNEGGKEKLNAQYAEIDSRGGTRKRRLDTMTARLIDWDSRSIVHEVEVDLAELQQMVTQLHGILEATVPKPTARRVSEADATHSDLDPPRSEQLQQAIDRLTYFETRVTEFETDMAYLQDDIGEDIDALVEAKREDLGEKLPVDSALPSEAEVAIKKHVSDLQGVEQSANHTGEQVGLIAEEVGNLIRQTDSAKKNMLGLSDGLAQLKRDRAAVGAMDAP